MGEVGGVVERVGAVTTMVGVVAVTVTCPGWETLSRGTVRQGTVSIGVPFLLLLILLPFPTGDLGWEIAKLQRAGKSLSVGTIGP